MTASKTFRLSGWGQTPAEECAVWRPEKVHDIIAPVESMVARGYGRSYGDAALNTNVVSTERLNRFISFDENTGQVQAEAGVSLSDLIHVCLPRGWFPAVVPGTQHVSLGGAIAADIHGKNHHHQGSFASIVIEFDLIVADGRRITCSRDNDSELFWATVGGMGLTGIIDTVTIKLTPVETAYIVSRNLVTTDLEDCFNVLERHEEDSPYSVAWLDLLSKDQFGRGIVLLGHHAGFDDLPTSLKHDCYLIAPHKTMQVPFNMPGALLNPIVMRAYNQRFYQKHAAQTSMQVIDYERYFFPLDNIGHWNRLYGKSGFLQYQCVVPSASAYDTIKNMLDTLSRNKIQCYLAVLKHLGEANQGLLSFPIAGYTLALDFPARQTGLYECLHQLDSIVADCGGRVYLAKDVRMSRELFEKMYPALQDWKSVKQSIDPNNRFSSSLAKRLGLINEPHHAQ